MNPILQRTPAAGGTQDESAEPAGAVPAARKPLGELLVSAGTITSAQLDDALYEGSQTGARIGEVVVGRGWASEDQVARLLADQWGLSYVDRASIWFDADALARLSREDAQRLEALPTQVQDGRVVVAVAEPTEQRLAALRRVIGEDTVVVVVPKTALEAGLHSELLASHRQQPTRDAAAVETKDDGESPFLAALVEHPASVPAAVGPHPEAVAPPQDVMHRVQQPAAASGGLEDVEALAAEARSVADRIEAQAAALREQALSSETLSDYERRIEQLEAELAEQRAATVELKQHLAAMLHLLDR